MRYQPSTSAAAVCSGLFQYAPITFGAADDDLADLADRARSRRSAQPDLDLDADRRLAARARLRARRAASSTPSSVVAIGAVSVAP